MLASNRTSKPPFKLLNISCFIVNSNYRIRQITFDRVTNPRCQLCDIQRTLIGRDATLSNWHTTRIDGLVDTVFGVSVIFWDPIWCGEAQHVTTMLIEL